MNNGIVKWTNNLPESWQSFEPTVHSRFVPREGQGLFASVHEDTRRWSGMQKTFCWGWGYQILRRLWFDRKRWRSNVSLSHEVIVPDHPKRPLLCNLALIDLRVTEDSHNFSWEGMMSLVSWYDPIPFHFCIFSISALTLTYHDA